MIKVSFIIPVYNASAFIERCLNSIFALGIPEKKMEIICVDDCSPDNTVEVISAIAASHPSVHLLRHEVNKRQGGGSNTAIRYAHGDYAVFMDQDDEILPYDLLGQIEYMQQNDLELPDLQIQAAHKYGQYSEFYHDIGIVYDEHPYVIAILTKEGNKDFESIVKDINNHIYKLHTMYNENRKKYCHGLVYDK